MVRTRRTRLSPLLHLTNIADGAARGLNALQVADGPFTIEERDGHKCWIAPASAKGTHLYFNVNDDFAQKLTGTVEIEYVFLDKGQGVVQLHYDSTDATAPVDGAYKALPPTTRQNTGEWRRVTHRLPDPHFQNRQNGLTDLRLHIRGAPLPLREITLRRR